MIRKKILLGLVLPLFVFAQTNSLKTLVEHASKENELIKAKSISIKSKKFEVESAKSAYWPTVDVGGSYSELNPNSLVSPGKTTTGYASISIDVYDGGRKSALLSAKRYEEEAASFEKAAFEKSITLDIVRHYYNIKKYKANLHALEERSSELTEQIKRVKKFKASGLSTQEEVDKLQAVFDSNNYSMANTKLALVTSENNLQLLTGLSVKNLKNNHLKEPKNVEFEVFETIKMLEANANSIGEQANAIDSGYMPQVQLSDTYNKSNFDDTVSIPGFSSDSLLVDSQNKLMLSVNMRLFDNGKMDKESEAVRYKKLALDSEISYAMKEQEMNFHLSGKSLEALRSKRKSAKSALRAAKSTYDALKEKFEVGLVDNIAFLDALTQKTLQQSNYKETLYDYEISKSIYYYYAGKDPKEFIQ